MIAEWRYFPIAPRRRTLIDLAFPDGFVPRDTEDTFDRRLDAVIETVARLPAAAARLSMTGTPCAEKFPAGVDPDARRSIHR
ncbi:hypothetical protein KZZ52_42540 [Dactylosporangium sp. AC04546]|uniref:hypothetical protein n=1 Tax=Dactylosporangium sp. AC04546 TaxID=2862460 RepID=UPI001EDCA26D|nr:hypothetical protein [Dactylosporangium sp. AC04546]WVK80594.1 hypothetical protein KZZ52_42540 [Dactylosporangium sp. AC04546]